MKVTVLYGGPSAEREVSLVSGKAVIEALRSVGHEVFGSDVSCTDLSGLEHPADVVFPVLHGAFGESGELQEIMEERGICFVGSSSAASHIAIDKVRAKQLWESVGLPTPAYEMLSRDGGPAAPTRLSVPCVIKPVECGSSIDVKICKNAADAQTAPAELFTRHDRLLVERYIAGIELTVG